MVIKMFNKSIWLKNFKEKKLDSLKEDIKTDILIIGGGITGLSTSYFLKDSGKDVVLVDSGRIACGTSSRTTGKITYLQGTIYQKIRDVYGIDIAYKYLSSQKEACSLIKNIIIVNNIKCDYQSNSSYIFTNKNISKVKSEMGVLNRFNTPFKISKSLPINYPIKLAVKIDDSAVFHPIKYLMEIKRICLDSGIKMYENTMVKSLEKTSDGYIATTNKYKIKAKRVVLACFYPFFLSPGLFPFRTYLKKEYVSASLIDSYKRFNAIDDTGDVESIRYHSDSKNYLIYTGCSKKLGSNMDNEKNYSNLFWKVKSSFSDNIKYYWFNYDIMTADYMPLIGYYEKYNKDLLIGTGYNAWGMTNGTLAGKIISDLLLNKDNPYINLFNPNRKTNISKIANTINYNLKNGLSFIKSRVNSYYDFYPKNIKIVNKKIGIYKDDKKKDHKVCINCPHMKCGLIFNTVDKTWDCPCHGSRFNIDGKVIKGPSVDNIGIK